MIDRDEKLPDATSEDLQRPAMGLRKKKNTKEKKRRKKKKKRREGGARRSRRRRKRSGEAGRDERGRGGTPIFPRARF